MLLVIAATPQELAGAAGARTLVCGIGPRKAYLATEDAVAEGGADGVLHVGIAGARSGSGIPLLATVVGTEAVDCDGDSEPIAPAAKLLAAARRALPDALALPIGTSARVGGRPASPSRPWKASRCSRRASTKAYRRSSCAWSRTRSRSPIARSGASTRRWPSWRA